MQITDRMNSGSPIKRKREQMEKYCDNMKVKARSALAVYKRELACVIYLIINIHLISFSFRKTGGGPAPTLEILGEDNPTICGEETGIDSMDFPVKDALPNDSASEEETATHMIDGDDTIQDRPVDVSTPGLPAEPVSDLPCSSKPKRVKVERK